MLKFKNVESSDTIFDYWKIQRMNSSKAMFIAEDYVILL